MSESKYKSSNKHQPKTVEEIYQVKDPITHVLKRPDTYVGSIEMQAQAEWVLQPGTMNKVQYVPEAHFPPGLYKVYDEILVNAADNRQRDPEGMTKLAVDFNPDDGTGSISVRNNGKTIPVQIHAVAKMYVAQLIFGHMMSGSNFDDTIDSGDKGQQVAKTTGGRNGFGAKLANIFSKKFMVECNDVATNGKYLCITWTDNMRTVQAPVIRASKGKADWTRITFWPDWEKFGMTKEACFQPVGQPQGNPVGQAQGNHVGQLNHLLAVMRRRVLDIAGTSRPAKGFSVTINGEASPVRGFKQYVQMYVQHQQSALQPAIVGENEGDAKSETEADAEEKLPVIYHEFNERWEIAVARQPENVRLQHVSFVNNIATSRDGGGPHAEYVWDGLIAAILEQLPQRLQAHVTPAMIKNHLWLFVNCLIDNPSFDTQTKTYMTRKSKDFGRLDLLPSFKDDAGKKLAKRIISRLGLVDALDVASKAKELMELAKMSAKGKATATSAAAVRSILKLDDAELAGSKKHSHECTLILTEGDSAKALAVSGVKNMSAYDKQRYGVFPLKGKLLNVRGTKTQTILKNSEIRNLVQILGLKLNHTYESRDEVAKSLRYGRVVLMTDQDYDGSHIKGLFLNLMATIAPSAFKLGVDHFDGQFVWEFVTPIVRVKKAGARGKGKRTKADKIDFFTLPEFFKWEHETKDAHGWDNKQLAQHFTIKYYKGLGTSTAEDAKDYFTNLDRHVVPFAWHDSKDEHAILDDAFNRKKTHVRKRMLDGLTPDTFLQHIGASSISMDDFVKKDLLRFFQESNERAIPSVMDGLKPGQRKIIFACLKRNLRSEIKVSQLAGYTSEHAAYHHGEVSLCGTIINMAQGFKGANNVNLLWPEGQFGTYAEGGQNASSPRYITTYMHPMLRKIFHPDDDSHLRYLFEDGQSIQPEYYETVLPMVLVNGAEGLGTGYSTEVPQFNPRDLADNLRHRMKYGRWKREPMVPWYRFFMGTIRPATAGDETSPPKTPQQQQQHEEKSAAMPAPTQQAEYPKTYVTLGKIAIQSNQLCTDGGRLVTVHITELPIGTCIAAYKKKLVKWIAQQQTEGQEKKRSAKKKAAAAEDDLEVDENGDPKPKKRKREKKEDRQENDDDDTVKKPLSKTAQKRQDARPPHIVGFVERHPKHAEGVCFEVQVKTPAQVPEPQLLDPHRWHLVSRLSLNNLVLFDRQGKLRRYATVTDILEDFFQGRVQGYDARKRHMMAALEKELRMLANRVRFVQAILDGKLQLHLSPSRAQVLQWLRANNFDSLREKAQSNDEEKESDDSSDAAGYSYLMNMSLWTPTREKVEAYRRELASKQQTLDALRNETVESMWNRDLDAILSDWNEFCNSIKGSYAEEDENDDEADDVSDGSGPKKRRRQPRSKKSATATTAPKKKQKTNN